MQKVRQSFNWGLCLLASFLMLSLWIGVVYAQEIPHLIRYQGSLEKADVRPGKGTPPGHGGTPPGHGGTPPGQQGKPKIYDLTFRIYNVETDGIPLWEETQPEVSVEKGEFEVMLGSIIPLDLSFDEDYWLSIEIENEGEIAPRQRLTSVAYAYMAEDTWKLGGRFAEEYALSEHSHLGEDIISPVAEAVNADMLDGLHAHEIAGVKDHGNLLGLADDDHPHYLTVGRGDARYAGGSWDGLTKLETAQSHIADKTNPHEVTLEQLGHWDNNPEEEAPTTTERGEPTGTEIQQWADDITIWGHSNVVSNLNADKLDGRHSSEFALVGHLHLLQNLADVSSPESAAFNAAGVAGASATNRLATMADVEAVSTGAETYKYAEMVEGQAEAVIAGVLDPTYYTIPDMSITHTFAGNPVKVSFTASISGNPSITVGGIPAPTLAGGQFAIFIDGERKVNTAKLGEVIQVDSTPGGWTSEYETVTLQWLENLAQGEHTIEIRWRGALVASGSSEEGGSRVLIVEEL